MRRAAGALLVLLSGCSTAPIADFLDFVRPGNAGADMAVPYHGGVGVPVVPSGPGAPGGLPNDPFFGAPPLAPVPGATQPGPILPTPPPAAPSAPVLPPPGAVIPSQSSASPREVTTAGGVRLGTPVANGGH